jgi:hypothetical protein
MDSGELMPNFEQYGNISSSTSQQAIETIDMVPTNPQ